MCLSAAGTKIRSNPRLAKPQVLTEGVLKFEDNSRDKSNFANPSVTVCARATSPYPSGGNARIEFLRKTNCCNVGQGLAPAV